MSSFLYGCLFHAKLLKNNSTIKYCSVLKKGQNANGLNDKDFNRQLKCDGKSTQSTKNLLQVASVSDFLFIFASEYVFSCS